MEIDTHLLSDEQINKINETVAEMLKKNLYKKWWIRPTHGLYEPYHNGCSSYVVVPKKKHRNGLIIICMKKICS